MKYKVNHHIFVGNWLLVIAFNFFYITIFRKFLGHGVLNGLKTCICPTLRQQIREFFTKRYRRKGFMPRLIFEYFREIVGVVHKVNILRKLTNPFRTQNRPDFLKRLNIRRDITVTNEVGFR